MLTRSSCVGKFPLFLLNFYIDSLREFSIGFPNENLPVPDSLFESSLSDGRTITDALPVEIWIVIGQCSK